MAVIFDRKKVAPKKEGLFEIRIKYGARYRYYSTGIRAKRQSALTSDEAARLAAIETGITRRITEMIEHGVAIDIDEALRLTVSGSHPMELLDFFNDRANERHMAEGTRKHYFTTLHKLNDWGQMTIFSDCTVENITKFDEYLHGLGIGDGGIYTYHKCLKSVLNDAESFGKITYNPYARLKRRIRRGEKQTIDYLTEQEFEKVRTTFMPSLFLEHARDLFVFQTFTALSYTDLVQFDINEYRHEGGRYYKVDNTRIKTGKKYVTQLLSPAVTIGEKYDWHLPIMTNQEYNRALKLVAMAAGVRPIHTHMARSTFATWALSHGVPMQNVSRMLGHTSVTMTMRRYAKVLETDVRSNFDMLDELLK